MLIELYFQISTTGMVITLVIVSVAFFVKVMSLKRLIVVCYRLQRTLSK